MSGLKSRLLAAERLVGTWVKTPSPLVCEVLSQTALDVVVLDAEHAPFGPSELDACVFACRAGGLASLVRVPTSQAHHIGAALDVGATGVLVPHVRTAVEANTIVRAAHFGPNGRGYAGSTRAAGYGSKPMDDHKSDSATGTVVIAQIEDADAVDEAGAIGGVEGIDAVFVGTVDLSVSMGAASPTSAEVLDAVRTVVAAANAAACPVGIFANTAEQMEMYAQMGAKLFLMQSDHAFLKAGADALVGLRNSTS